MLKNNIECFKQKKDWYQARLYDQTLQEKMHEQEQQDAYFLEQELVQSI